MVERLGREARVNGITNAVVATIDPGKNLEGLAGDEHLAIANNRASRFVANFGLNRIFVVAVAVQLLRERGVDLDVYRSIRADFALNFSDDFRRRVVPARPPDRPRPMAAGPVAIA